MNATHYIIQRHVDWIVDTLGLGSFIHICHGFNTCTRGLESCYCRVSQRWIIRIDFSVNLLSECSCCMSFVPCHMLAAQCPIIVVAKLRALVVKGSRIWHLGISSIKRANQLLKWNAEEYNFCTDLYNCHSFAPSYNNQRSNANTANWPISFEIMYAKTATPICHNLNENTPPMLRLKSSVSLTCTLRSFAASLVSVCNSNNLHLIK